MKKLLTFLLLGWGLNACQQPAAPLATDEVNALVDNAGYVAATGHAPTTATADDARVRAHLAFAERQLRQQPVANLHPALAARRAHLLDLLHRYWVAGVFPRNYDHPGERRPCFIDRDGRLCAVGYLVAATAGRAVAEGINAAHQYDAIADMRAPALARWVRHSGLSVAECALIQPNYGTPTPTPNPAPVSDAFAVGSAAWSGLNVALSAINASQLQQLRPERGPVYLGVLSGAGQILFGALHLPKDEQVWGINIGWNPPVVQSYATERTVSYLSIGLGTATLGLSAWNLLRHRPTGAGRTAVGVVNYGGGGSGVAVTRRF